MRRDQCPGYQRCSAPLCPLDEDSLRQGIWYPDEEICKSRQHSSALWIKAQKKIARKARRRDRYFTYEMLARNCIITPGIRGLDPDRPRQAQLEVWLRKHPPKRKLTEQERAKLRERMLALSGRSPENRLSAP